MPCLVLVLCFVVSAEGEPGIVVYAVRPGDTLERIARRYDVTIEAICRANSRTREQKLFPKERLIIPARAKQSTSERTPSNINSARPGLRGTDASGEFHRPAMHASLWKRYVREPRERGYVILSGHGRRFSGQTGMTEALIPETTRRAFRQLLFNHHNGQETELSGRLIRLLVLVSDTFGGREINIVSGYRDISFAQESRHLRGAACDFSVVGVSNLALFSFLSSLPHVGVGYYPNSTFVHLDIRPKKSVWIDLAGPGEPPRYADPNAYFKNGALSTNSVDE